MKLPSFITTNPYIAGGLAAVFILIIIAMGMMVKSCAHQQDKANANLVNQGVVIERSQQQSETINAVSNAQEAVRNPTSNQLNIVCSRYDRNCPHHP